MDCFVRQVKFVTRIYHPNVKTDSGEICSDILNENWGPTLNVTYVLNTIRQVRVCWRVGESFDERGAGSASRRVGLAW